VGNKKKHPVEVPADDFMAGVEVLSFIKYGRKIIFRKLSVACWQERNEKGRLAA